MINQLHRFTTISQFHRFRNLPTPEHPLISVIDMEDIKNAAEPVNMVPDFYSVALKRNFNGKFKYGQLTYDYDEGFMTFISPGQVYSIEHSAEEVANLSGWLLLIHPDFLWNTPLAKNIKQYGYFSYSVHEALFLSEKEEAIINNIIQNIRQEYHSSIDKFSQNIIIPQIETLLNYAERFYKRQFITRKITNHQVLERLEEILADYFNGCDAAAKGLPTVQYVCESLHISPGYLSGLLKTLTGKSTQQHIHDKLIEKAKEKLSVTGLSVSEIAYELGFEHPQSFNKLFKTKTQQSPLQFRASFA